jgi:ElaB/YqjD/DUF883 family membrane-anchored ribosome-binding protein
MASAARSNLEDRVSGVRSGVEEARDAFTATVGGFADKARATFHDARDAVAGAAQKGGQSATHAVDGVGDRVSSTADAMKSYASESTDRVGEMARTSRYAVTDFVNDNPLLVAGIGAAVGAVIAASIPSSEAENRLFGAGNEKLKDKAREAAAQGIEKVGDLAAETAGSVAAAASREGLDAAGVQGALNQVADPARAVAERGLDTALGEEKQIQPDQSFERPTSERNH